MENKNLKGCLFVILIFVGIIVLFSIFSSKTKSLKAEVKYLDGQIIIQNNDNFDYKNADIQINDTYSLKVDNIPSGMLYRVGVMQFSDKTGNRFNILMKLNKLTISVYDTNNDLYIYAGTQ